MRQEGENYVGKACGHASQPEPLRESEQQQALTFLQERPLHTVYMASLIRDNGVQSPLNRGRFYRYMSNGEIEGIALLGHATLIEARTESALSSFARLAQHSSLPHLIRGEEDLVMRFWNQYEKSGQSASRVCRELLLEQKQSPAIKEATGLRQATLNDLETVIRVNSEMALAESGSDPLQRDPEGFRSRVTRRIKRGRNWIWVEGGRVLFKADIIADTPQVIYLEGIYVDPELRGNGYGSMGLTALTRKLLSRSGSVCLTLNARKEKTRSFYRRAGYVFRSHYDTIYLQAAN
ncbi:MAG TPA: GNAT family N-acetyltransferase [Pyrinomonadaceae bacterium]|nr:GNAT family N-acetyltransferase [Pyrinomonadaceae bacterium]